MLSIDIKVRPRMHLQYHHGVGMIQPTCDAQFFRMDRPLLSNKFLNGLGEQPDSLF
jgi:hypothetical protein